MEPRALEDEIGECDSLDQEFFGPDEPLPSAGAEPEEAAPELLTPGPVPTTPAMSPGDGTGSLMLQPTSSNFTKQWKLLGRVAAGPRAKQFPTIAELWKGDSASKQRALRMYLESQENLETAESRLHVEKSHSETLHYKRAWLTIKQMKEQGMSENLVCIMFPCHFGKFALLLL